MDRSKFFLIVVFFIVFAIVLLWKYSGSDDEKSEPQTPNAPVSNELNLCQQQNGTTATDQQQQFVANFVQRLELNDNFTDIEIAYTGGVLRAHKIILAAQSDHLDKILGDPSHANDSRLELPSLNNEIMLSVLNYMYTGAIQFDNFEYATNMLMAANLLSLESLKCKSSAYLSQSISTTSVSRILVIANEANSTYLMTNATTFLFSNLSKIRGTTEWNKTLEKNKGILATAIDYHGKLPSNGTCDIRCYSTTLRSKYVSDNLAAFFEVDRYADAEIHSHRDTMNFTFHVNKAILMGQSKRFKEQFQQTPNAIQIEANVDIVKEFLRFMYSSHVIDLDVNAEGLYALAVEYQMYALQEACENVIINRLSVANVVNTLKIAGRTQSKRLSKEVSEFILKNKQEVVKTKAWAEMKDNEPELVANVFQ